MRVTRGALLMWLMMVVPGLEERAQAHGVAGERRFIESFVTEDASVQNEAIVQGSYVRRDGRIPGCSGTKLRRR